LDLITHTPQLASLVLANFKQVVKQGQLSVHPIVGRQVDRKVLEQMGFASSASVDGPASVN
jgi:cytolysin-activating lysine-acyltransferase